MVEDFLIASFLQVSKAKETEEKIDVELKELQATLANIEQARPFEQLTVCHSSLFSQAVTDVDQTKTEDVGKAHPRIVEAVETMIKKGKWTVPGTFWSLVGAYPQFSTCPIFFRL